LTKENDRSTVAAMSTPIDVSFAVGGDQQVRPTGPRERLLDAAEALIYAGGIHATGVDAIVRAARATRKSFYSYFESKDALVASALERRHERWMTWFVQGTLRKGRTPRTRLLGMFHLLREWFESPGFHGCAFLNAAGEIASPDDSIRTVARAHKAALLGFIYQCCEAFAAEHGLAARQAAALARQWLVLVDGAIGVALVSGSADAARDAHAAGRRLLDHVPPSQQRPPPSRTKRTSPSE
jgi:AcrR family transcriptional regulator